LTKEVKSTNILFTSHSFLARLRIKFHLFIKE
jgi:hypothetical protein